MLQLNGTMSRRWFAEPLVLRVTTNSLLDPEAAASHAFLVKADCERLPKGFPVYLAIEGTSLDERACMLPETMAFLAPGDVVRIVPSAGLISVLFRRKSRSNFMLLTERCNSYCLMCSQPPREVDDHYLVETYLAAIPLMDKGTNELVITGGEPMLIGESLFCLIRTCKEHLPTTALHMLSNGRLFNYLSLSQKLTDVGHPDLMIGIPVYSDIARRHDFVVQAKGAFDQTIRGIMNLERCGVRVEIRVVLHRETIGRLPQLARFIARNLPFVEHVALMGLEQMGFGKLNCDALWIDPVDYQAELSDAVRTLANHQMGVSIYNHQLCTLPRDFWHFARQSISDWKNEYLPECDGCSVRDECGGFFSSSRVRHSAFIRAVN